MFRRTLATLALSIGMALAATAGTAQAGTSIPPLATGCTHVSGGCYSSCTLNGKNGAVAVVIVSTNVPRLITECWAFFHNSRNSYTVTWGLHKATGISEHILCAYAKGADVFAVYSLPRMANVERILVCGAKSYWDADGEWKRTSLG